MNRQRCKTLASEAAVSTSLRGSDPSNIGSKCCTEAPNPPQFTAAIKPGSEAATAAGICSVIAESNNRFDCCLRSFMDPGSVRRSDTCLNPCTARQLRRTHLFYSSLDSRRFTLRMLTIALQRSILMAVLAHLRAILLTVGTNTVTSCMSALLWFGHIGLQGV